MAKARVGAWKIAGAAFALCVATTIVSPAQTFTSLLDFDGSNGTYPQALIQGRDGSYFGTTSSGGANNVGTVFRVTPDGVLTTLYSFCAQPDCVDGEGASSGLLLTNDGSLYGTTSSGGNSDSDGTIFKIDGKQTLTTLHLFTGSDGATPFGTLIRASDGNFYGITIRGGLYDNGTVFKLTPDGTLTTLHSFNVSDGSFPEAGLVEGTNGRFYGTTAFGGTDNCQPFNGCGTIFKITPAGRFTTLHFFNGDDGVEPVATMVEGIDNSLYGTTLAGGGGDGVGNGTIFKVGPNGGFTTIRLGNVKLRSPDGSLTQDTNGNFYGTTFYGGDLSCNAGLGCGTIFEVTPRGSISVLHAFEIDDGLGASAGLLQGTNGIFYGTTTFGGSENEGTIFSLDMGLGPFVTFVRAAGKVGQTGGILGQGFTGTSSVMLNGIQASFTVVSDTYIRATVPVGATTGYVTVTTPSGTLTSNVPFHVIR